MTNTTSFITHDELLSAIYTHTSHGVTFKDTPDGVTTFRNDHQWFAIGQEFQDDGETFWGWTWTTGGYDNDGDREIMEYFEYFYTDASQDASEALAAAIRHLGAIEDNR